MKVAKSAGTIFRVLLSVGLVMLGYLFIDLDIKEIWGLLSQLDPKWALTAVALLTMQLLLTSFRWYLINKSLEIPTTLKTCLRLMFVGQFFNQCLPTSIGGDGVKIGVMCKVGMIPLQTSVLSVLTDRIVGLLVLILVACTSWLVFVNIWPTPILQEGTISIILVCCTLVPFITIFLIFPRIAHILKEKDSYARIRALASASNTLAMDFKVSINIFWLSAAVQVLIALSIYCGSRALNVDLPLLALLLIPLIIFVASVPFSFAGWGLREGAMITGLAILGISANEAISISILHGVAQLLIGLPGAYIAVTQIGANFGPSAHYK